jgi:hypothetical protein
MAAVAAGIIVVRGFEAHVDGNGLAAMPPGNFIQIFRDIGKCGLARNTEGYWTILELDQHISRDKTFVRAFKHNYLLSPPWLIAGSLSRTAQPLIIDRINLATSLLDTQSSKRDTNHEKTCSHPESGISSIWLFSVKASTYIAFDFQLECNTLPIHHPPLNII